MAAEREVDAGGMRRANGKRDGGGVGGTGEACCSGVEGLGEGGRRGTRR